MTTSVREQALAETEKAVKVMERAGLRVQPYVRPPLAPELLAMAIQSPKPGRIRLWSGLADLEIHRSKKHRQVVLTANESDREITRTYEVHVYSDGTNIRRRAQDQFPVHIPRSRFTSLDFEETTAIELGVKELGWRDYRVTATKSAPDTTSSFLMGMDESYHFISALPQVVSSVAEAHDVLRPPRVPKDALRQGEFFFVPAPAYMVRRLNDTLARSAAAIPNVRQWRQPRFLRPLEQDSTHRGVAVHSSGKTYAIGPIVDIRVGHHSMLMLDRWHRVIRNTEERVREAEVRKRTRTWD